jgi:hypothetical protein
MPYVLDTELDQAIAEAEAAQNVRLAEALRRRKQRVMDSAPAVEPIESPLPTPPEVAP